MIGIGGLARAGKDTLASNLAEIIKDELGCDVKIFSFADIIKSQVHEFFEEYYGIDSFTEKTEEKNIIRDLLVAHGETMKKLYGNRIWADSVILDIKESEEKFFPIIPDVRFDFEVDAVKEEGGTVIHISKIGNEPPNETEFMNDPLVRSSADICHSWPPYEPDEMHQCKDHAQILWQMLKQTEGEKWKKIYS
jgi:hypothetical protein